MTGEGMDGANQTGSLDQADNHGDTNESGIDVVLVTGLSGAGRGTAGSRQSIRLQRSLRT